MSTATWILIYVLLKDQNPQAVSMVGPFSSRAHCEAAAEQVGLPKMRNVAYVCSRKIVI